MRVAITGTTGFVGRHLVKELITKKIQNIEELVIIGRRERDDLPQIYSMFNVFCLHSKTEGFPNVLGEAMASKVVCITTDVGDARYLIGNDYLVVKKEDSVLFAGKMLQVMQSSSEERQMIGQALHSRILSKFTIEKIVESYFNVYRDCKI